MTQDISWCEDTCLVTLSYCLPQGHENTVRTMTTTTTTLLSVIFLLSASVRPEAVTSQSGDLPSDLLPVEHRSESGRSAEPESLLDSIASLFGGGQKTAQKKIGPRPGPVYRPQSHHQPHLQAQQQSIQRPVAVAPPATFNKKPFNSGLKPSSSSSIKRQTTGETKSCQNTCLISSGLVLIALRTELSRDEGGEGRIS